MLSNTKVSLAILHGISILLAFALSFYYLYSLTVVFSVAPLIIGLLWCATGIINIFNLKLTIKQIRGGKKW